MAGNSTQYSKALKVREVIYGFIKEKFLWTFFGKSFIFTVSFFSHHFLKIFIWNLLMIILSSDHTFFRHFQRLKKDKSLPSAGQDFCFIIYHLLTTLTFYGYNPIINTVTVTQTCCYRWEREGNWVRGTWI